MKTVNAMVLGPVPGRRETPVEQEQRRAAKRAWRVANRERSRLGDKARLYRVVSMAVASYLRYSAGASPQAIRAIVRVGNATDAQMLRAYPDAVIGEIAAIDALSAFCTALKQSRRDANRWPPKSEPVEVMLALREIVRAVETAAVWSAFAAELQNALEHRTRVGRSGPLSVKETRHMVDRWLTMLIALDGRTWQHTAEKPAEYAWYVTLIVTRACADGIELSCRSIA